MEMPKEGVKDEAAICSEEEKAAVCSNTESADSFDDYLMPPETFNGDDLPSSADTLHLGNGKGACGASPAEVINPCKGKGTSSAAEGKGATGADVFKPAVPGKGAPAEVLSSPAYVFHPLYTGKGKGPYGKSKGKPGTSRAEGDSCSNSD